MFRRFLISVVLIPCLGFHWPGEVYRIQRAIEHAEPSERRELVRRLAQFSAESVKQPVLLALEDQDLQVRLEAAAVAARVRLREAVPILLDWLDDKEPQTRRAAAAALGRIGEERAVPPLVRALGDVQGEVRRAAVGALATLGSQEALVPLTGRLDDPDLSVRVEAIAALAEMRDARSIVPLLGASADPSAEVRAAALNALGAIGDARGLPALTRALADEVDAVQLAAAAALGRLGEQGGVRALKASLERAEPRLGQAIMAALGNIDHDDARALLVAQLAVPALRRSATLALVRQARSANENASRALVEAIGDVLAGNAELPVKVAAAEALSKISEVAPIGSAVDAVLATLSTAEGELAAAAMRALGMSGAQAALLPLLERIGQAQGPALDAALDAVQQYFERGEPDGRAADPLLAKLPSASPAQRVQIVELLGRVRAARALPSLAALFGHEQDALRLAAVRATGELATRDAAPALLSLLDHRDPATRFEAARALRASADEQAIHALLSRLLDRRAQDRHALLVALGGGLARVASQGKLQPQMAEAALLALSQVAQGEDDALADRAMNAIAVWAPPRALEALAPNLRSPSSRKRATATIAIGLLRTQEARNVIRYALGSRHPRDAAAAALALAEIGDERDLKALVKASQRKSWPVPGAAVFALARMAQRDALRPHAAARALCGLGRSREPYVRANVAAAMAALGARGCEDGGPDPLGWLAPTNAPIVRAAAARWLHAAATAERVDAAIARAALARCAARDLEQSVREVCASPELPETREATDVYAYAQDGATLLRNRLVALRLGDGSVFLGYTDLNGHVRLASAPRGGFRLEQPELVPIEPPQQDAPAQQ